MSYLRYDVLRKHVIYTKWCSKLPGRAIRRTPGAPGRTAQVTDAFRPRVIVGVFKFVRFKHLNVTFGVINWGNYFGIKKWAWLIYEWDVKNDTFNLFFETKLFLHRHRAHHYNRDNSWCLVYFSSRVCLSLSLTSIASVLLYSVKGAHCVIMFRLERNRTYKRCASFVFFTLIRGVNVCMKNLLWYIYLKFEYKDILTFEVQLRSYMGGKSTAAVIMT